MCGGVHVERLGISCAASLEGHPPDRLLLAARKTADGLGGAQGEGGGAGGQSAGKEREICSKDQGIDATISRWSWT